MLRKEVITVNKMQFVPPFGDLRKWSFGSTASHQRLERGAGDLGDVTVHHFVPVINVDVAERGSIPFRFPAPRVHRPGSDKGGTVGGI